METKDIYAKIAKDEGLPQTTVKKVCTQFFNEIGNELAVNKNAKIKVARFGVFEVKMRKSRKGINNLTKEEVVIPERRVPVFHFSQVFKDKVDHFG